MITKLAKIPPSTPLFLGAGFILWWFSFYFTDRSIPSVDLPSFFALVEGLRNQKLLFPYFDETAFGGWVPFLFYGFLPALCVAGASFIFDAFTEESVRLTTHIFLVCGVALLPFTIYFAGLPTYRELTSRVAKNREAPLRMLFCLSSVVFGFWFLNHDRQWYGIGAAAVMNIGLFSQLFGWHLLLLAVGSLLRVLETDNYRDFFLLVISVALLIVSHLLTAVFAVFIAALSVLWFAEKRKQICLALAFSFGLSAFWFLPFFLLVGDWTPLDIHPPKGDFLDLFFRYSWQGLATTVQSYFTGQRVLLNPMPLVCLALLLLALGSRAVPRAGLTRSFLFFNLSALVFFSSGFVASGLPFGLHYYRFQGYIFLLLLTLLTPAIVLLTPNAFLTGKELKPFKRAASLFLPLAVLLAGFGFSVALPHKELGKLNELSRSDYLDAPNQVVDHFKKIPGEGRIFIEHLTDKKTFPYLSAHYLSWQISKQTQFNVISNSHLQESLSYRLIAASAKLLSAKTYNVPLLFLSKADLDAQTKISQLKDFGITHIIAGRQEFLDKISEFSINPPIHISPYWIVQIQPSNFKLVEPLKKEPIGYMDIKGNAPFTLMQYYFYSRKDLYNAFTLVNLNPGEPVPGAISSVIVNNSIRDLSENISPGKRSMPTLFRMNFKDDFVIDHYSPQYQHNTELRTYKQIDKYLEKVIELKTRVLEKATRPEHSGVNEDIKAHWDAENQTITVYGLRTDSLYSLNLSYFPQWEASGGQIYRSSGERIILHPQESTMTLRFSHYRQPAAIWGIVISLLAVVGLVGISHSGVLKHNSEIKKPQST